MVFERLAPALIRSVQVRHTTFGKVNAVMMRGTLCRFLRYARPALLFQLLWL